MEAGWQRDATDAHALHDQDRRTRSRGAAAVTRVDFYILADVDEIARQRFTCRLAGRALAAGKRVHVRVPERALEAIDALLWDYPPDRFLPHARVTPDAPPTAPIVVAAESDAPVHREVLVNLAPDIPDFFAGFERVSEIVLAGERAEGRAKYRRYRERGYPLFHHELDDWE